MRKKTHSTAAGQIALLAAIVTMLATLFMGTGPRATADDEIPIAQIQRDEPINFQREVLSIFRRKCLACHNATDAESDLVLETPQSILKGGALGPAVVANDSGESLLLKVASHQEEPFMPPPDNEVGAAPLSSDELGLIKLWIDQGATGEVTGDAPVQFQPLPPGVQPVYAVAVSPDGQYGAAGRANQVFLYHVPSRREIGRLTDPELLASGMYDKPGVAHLDLVQALVFSPDSQLLATSGYRTVKLWRRPANTEKTRLPGLDAPPLSALVSPDGSWIAVGQEDGKVLVYNADGTQLAHTLTGHTGPVTALAASADGKQLYSGSKDQTIRAWDPADGRLLLQIDTPAEVLSLARLGDGTKLASGGSDNLIRLWRIPFSAAAPLNEPAGPVVAFAVSQDRARLAIAQADGRIALVDPAALNVTQTLAGHQGGVAAISLNGDGTQLASVGADQMARVWLAASGESPVAIPVGPSPATAVAISPAADRIARGREDGSISVLALDTPDPRAVGGDWGAVPKVAATSADGRLLAAATSADGKPVVRIVDVASGNVLQTLAGHEGAITSIAFSGNAQRIVTGSEDRTARVWSVGDGALVATIGGHNAAVSAVALNADGGQATTAAADKVLAVWNVADGAQVRTLEGHGDVVASLAYTSDGSQVVSGSADGSVRVYNAGDGQLARTINAAAPVAAMSISRDNARLAVACRDHSVKLFNFGDGNLTVTLAAHESQPHWLSFSPDNARLVSADPVRVCVWECEKGALLEVLPGEAGLAAFGPDAGTLLLARGDNTVAAVALRFRQRLGDMTMRVTDLAWSPDGQAVFSSSLDGTLRRFNAGDGQQQFNANHGAAIHALAVSADGQWLATAGENAQIRVWNAANGGGAPKPQLDGFAGPVRSVAFSPDGKHVVGGDGSNGRALVFDVTEGTLVQAHSGQAAPLTGLAVLSTADAPPRVVSASGEGQPQVWPLAADVRLAGHSQGVSSLAAVGSTQLLSGSADGSLRQWESTNGQTIRQMNHGGPVNAVAATADGKRFASVSANNTAKLWNGENGQQVAELKGDYRATLRVEDVQRAVTLTKRHVENAKADLDAANKRKTDEENNAKSLAEAMTKAKEEFDQKVEAAKKPEADKEAADKELEVASTARATAEETKKTSDEAATKSAEDLNKAKAESDAANKAAAEADAAVKTAAQAAEQAKQAADKEPENAALKAAAEAAQKRLAEAETVKKAADEAKAVADKKLADTDTAKKAADEAKNKADQEFNNAQNTFQQAQKKAQDSAGPANKAVQERTAAEKALEAATRASDRAAAAAKEAADAVPGCEAEMAKTEEQAKAAEAAVQETQNTVPATEKPILATVFSPDGAILITAGDDAVVHTWDAETGAAIETLEGHGAPITALAPLGPRDILSTARNNTAIVWDGQAEWKLQRTIGSIDSPELLIDRVIALAFSSDGKLLATGGGEPSRSGELKIWNVEDGSLVREFVDAHSDTIFGLEFSPDDKMIASCGADRFMKIFDVETGTFVRAFEGHTHHVLGVTWRADGRMIATSGADNVIKVWDARTGDQLRTIQGFNKELPSIRFVSTSDNVIVAGGDTNVLMRNAANGGNVRNYGGSSDFVYSVDASDDGKTIVAGGQDGVMRIWQENGQVIAAFEPPKPDGS